MSEIKQSPVRDVRLALGLTQEKFSKKLGCSLSSERRFEYDGTVPTVGAVLTNFKRLAKQVGVTLEEPQKAQKQEVAP